MSFLTKLMLAMGEGGQHRGKEASKLTNRPRREQAGKHINKPRHINLTGQKTNQKLARVQPSSQPSKQASQQEVIWQAWATSSREKQVEEQLTKQSWSEQEAIAGICCKCGV